MKKVLIALDYDPTSQKVSETGFLLAKTLGAEVVLLHVLSDPAVYNSHEHITVMGFAGQIEKDKIQIDSIDGLRKASLHFLDKSKHHLGDKNITTLIKEGEFAESILKAAKDLKADIIVMGSHSKKWLENILIGSVTEKVLNQTSLPIFIVPTKKHN